MILAARNPSTIKDKPRFPTLLPAENLSFMFHDEIFPLYGVHENVFMFSYLIILFSFLIIYFKPILETQFPLLALALFCFAASILLDKISGSLKEQLHIGFLDSIIYEDGSKMVGILFWLVYFVTVIRKAAEKSMKPELSI